jgi:hypothetical protein
MSILDDKAIVNNNDNYYQLASHVSSDPLASHNQFFYFSMGVVWRTKFISGFGLCQLLY